MKVENNVQSDWTAGFGLKFKELNASLSDKTIIEKMIWFPNMLFILFMATASIVYHALAALFSAIMALLSAKDAAKLANHIRKNNYKKAATGKHVSGISANISLQVTNFVADDVGTAISHSTLNLADRMALKSYLDIARNKDTGKKMKKAEKLQLLNSVGAEAMLAGYRKEYPSLIKFEAAMKALKKSKKSTTK